MRRLVIALCGVLIASGAWAQFLSPESRARGLRNSLTSPELYLLPKGPTLQMGSLGAMSFTSAPSAVGAADTGMSRCAANTVCFGNGVDRKSVV